MNQLAYAVTRKDGAWTIRFSGRYFDQFPTEEAALAKAIEWARAAPRREAIMIKVALEHEDGRTEIVDPDGIAGFGVRAIRRSPTPLA